MPDLSAASQSPRQKDLTIPGVISSGRAKLFAWLRYPNPLVLYQRGCQKAGVPGCDHQPPAGEHLNPFESQYLKN